MISCDICRVDLRVDNILLDLDTSPYPEAFDELARREEDVPANLPGTPLTRLNENRCPLA